MKRLAAFLLLFSAGCSTAPVADFLDWAKPGRIQGNGPFYGGVAAPPPGSLASSPPPGSIAASSSPAESK